MDAALVLKTVQRFGVVPVRGTIIITGWWKAKAERRLVW